MRYSQLEELVWDAHKFFGYSRDLANCKPQAPGCILHCPPSFNESLTSNQDFERESSRGGGFPVTDPAVLKP